MVCRERDTESRDPEGTPVFQSGHQLFRAGCPTYQVSPKNFGGRREAPPTTPPPPPCLRTKATKKSRAERWAHSQAPLSEPWAQPHLKAVYVLHSQATGAAFLFV